MSGIPRAPLGLVQYVFRALGQNRLKVQDLVFFVSFDLHQMAPTKVREIIQELTNNGDLLVEKGWVSVSPKVKDYKDQPVEVQTVNLGELLRLFVSPSRLSRAVGLDDKSIEVKAQSKSPLVIQAVAHGTQEYQLILDEGKKLIGHNCPDWRRVSVLHRFCKHVAKLFLLMEKEEAIRLLQSIKNESWQFIEL